MKQYLKQKQRNFMLKYFIIALLSFQSFSDCIHEFQKTAEEIQTLAKYQNVLFLNEDNQFINFHSGISLEKNRDYTIQVSHPKRLTESNKGYNDRYLEYYSYAHIQKFLSNQSSSLNNIGYSYKSIGKSVQGRNLYYVAPKKLSNKKKTILMFGRHHGDEGTANWIIEGFVRKFIKDANFREKYQLVLYPMVNPDGAENHSRYNARRRDLNRVWHSNPEKSYDEVKVIQKHFLSQAGKADIMLDMHGSFTEDFIYRVDRNFLSSDYYNMQQSFIDTLGALDPYQNGNFQISNGHKKMARIYFLKNFNINSLTHETPRDIRRNGSRSIEDLNQQGIALLETINKEVVVKK